MARTITIEEQLHLPAALVQLLRMDFAEPVDDFQSAGEALRVDLCLTPRPPKTVARFVERWPQARFEAVGQVFIIPPRETLQFRAPRGQQVALACQLRPALIDPWLGTLDWTERRLEASLDVGVPRVASLLRFLAHELRYRTAEREAAADLITRQLCIELSRYLRAIDEPTTVGGLAGWRLKLIDGRLSEPSASPSLAELALLCNISVRQLTRGFRVSRGYSIGDHVAQRRMDIARRLLGGGESIKAIADLMGFASASSFSFAFRRATGVSPRLFRARVLRGL